MKNLTFPACLCLLFFVLQLSAQGTSKNHALTDFKVNLVDHTKSILSHTQTSERYKALLAALQATDLDKVLGYDGQFTVFAPSNNAFENLSGITKERLMDPENKNILKAVMGYHIIAGKLSASKILRAMCSGEGSASFTTIQGEKITASMLGTDIVLTDKMGNSAKITTADVNQSNGVIHEVDTVFFPVRI